MYRRGQVDWALWQVFTTNAAINPPRVFRNRVKRLLELDRSKPKSGEIFAFSEGAPEGKGTDAGFVPCDAFCLALGLDLLDTGFKQSEVVFALRQMRRELEKQFQRIMAHPFPLRMFLDGESAPPHWPRFIKDGIEYADHRVIMVISKIEIKEAYPRVKKDQPLIIKPKFYQGLENLCTEIDLMGHEYRSAIVVELAETGALVKQHLEKAPLMKRGRR